MGTSRSPPCSFYFLGEHISSIVSETKKQKADTSGSGVNPSVNNLREKNLDDPLAHRSNGKLLSECFKEEKDQAGTDGRARGGLEIQTPDSQGQEEQKGKVRPNGRWDGVDVCPRILKGEGRGVRGSQIVEC